MRFTPSSPPPPTSTPEPRLGLLVASLAALVWLVACSGKPWLPLGPTDADDVPSSTVAARAPVKSSGPPDYGIFRLKPEANLPCTPTEPIDVNLGHTPESFVRSVWCQLKGEEADAALVEKWARELRETRNTRRVDVARRLCIKAQRKCDTFAYSDPWQSQPDLLGAPELGVKRRIGAVLMFFFDCPGGVNCGMEWANNHAPGMDGPVPSLGFGERKEGVYTPNHPGWWRRELLDAQYAGLSFLMPNVYGPDIEGDKLKPLAEALASIDDPIQLGMFDDSWTWGEPWFSDFWKQRPNLNEVEESARTIYEHKWKPFFSAIDRKHWFTFQGKPFIYVYNAGKLEPRANAAPVFARMKELFAADFGVEPFLSVDSAYFDDRRMPSVAGAQFKWFTFQEKEKKFRFAANGLIIDHAMPRWDSFGREKPGQIAPPSGILQVKDGKVLQSVLDGSKDADLLILATWDDLGEGTGINRCYDYFFDGHWQAPDYFMQMIRKSQSGK